MKKMHRIFKLQENAKKTRAVNLEVKIAEEAKEHCMQINKPK